MCASLHLRCADRTREPLTRDSPYQIAGGAGYLSNPLSSGEVRPVAANSSFSASTSLPRQVVPAEMVLREAQTAWRSRPWARQDRRVRGGHARSAVMPAARRTAHVGTGDSSPTRLSTWPNSSRGMATSAICTISRRAWRMSRAPISTSSARSVVKLHRTISGGSTSPRRKLPRFVGQHGQR